MGIDWVGHRTDGVRLTIDNDLIRVDRVQPTLGATVDAYFQRDGHGLRPHPLKISQEAKSEFATHLISDVPKRAWAPPDRKPPESRFWASFMAMQTVDGKSAVYFRVIK
tara:strand:+ start:246 stop:572 length:327 start_codon:yes stop_codon:yes gene_type:complete